jgi:imidazole glycerol-phosphate synthase subunit HisF
MENMFCGAVKEIFKRAEELRKNPTAAKNLLWQYLKANQTGVRFKRQHPIWMYIADFYCHELKLVIEIDGSVHDLKEVKDRDVIREEDIRLFGIKVIRFSNNDIKTRLSEVVKEIQKIINELKLSDAK